MRSMNWLLTKSSFFNSSMRKFKNLFQKYMLQESLISDKIDERIFIYSNKLFGESCEARENFNKNIFKKRNKTKWKIALHPKQKKITNEKK